MSTIEAPSADELTELNWGVLNSPDRVLAAKSHPFAVLRSSSHLDRITTLATRLTSADCAQLSILGETQSVPSTAGFDGVGNPKTPLGQTLCSMVVSIDGPVSIADTGTHALASQMLPVVNGSVGSYCGVPVHSPEGECIGALCVFAPGTSQWSVDMVENLVDLAALITTELDAIRQRGEKQEQLAALTAVVNDLVAQTGEDLPDSVDGAYRSASSTRMGGDWFDVILRDDGARVVVIGDVVGHGLEAMATMTQLRGIAQAFVHQGMDPATILRSLHEVVPVVRPGAMATVLVFEVQSDQSVRASSAGHLPPLMVGADGTVEWASIASSPPVGSPVGTVAPGLTHWDASEMERIVAVTDGVFESRAVPYAETMEQLRGTIATIASSSAAFDRTDRAASQGSFADTIIDEMERQRGEVFDDDACVVSITL